jgi:hypothetical protein
MLEIANATQQTQVDTKAFHFTNVMALGRRGFMQMASGITLVDSPRHTRPHKPIIAPPRNYTVDSPD